jgi:hypothetical protein
MGYHVVCLFKLLVTANVAVKLLVLFTLMMESIRFSVTSVLARTTRRHITEDPILQSHCSENIRSYIALTGWAV